jgi:hypothetical protein
MIVRVLGENGKGKETTTREEEGGNDTIGNGAHEYARCNSPMRMSNSSNT